MYIAYIDSSGKPDPRDPEDFVLSSLITNENEWQKLDNLVKAIKIKHIPGLPDDQVEFHAKEMVNRDGIFRRFSLSEIYSMLDDIFDLIASDHVDLCLISVLIRKKRLFRGKDGELWGFRLLMERVNRFLMKTNDTLRQAGMAPQYGIMIIDSINRKPDQLVRNKMASMLKTGTYYSKLEYLIEDPLFTDSKWRNLSQLVDCVSYCVRRYHRASNPPSYKTTKWNEYYHKIEVRFDSDENGRREGCGLKIFP